MNIEEYYKQETDVKPAKDSCFANTMGITYHDGNIENEDIFSKDELTAFAEAYHQSQLKLLNMQNVSNRALDKITEAKNGCILAKQDSRPGTSYHMRVHGQMEGLLAAMSIIKEHGC